MFTVAEYQRALITIGTDLTTLELDILRKLHAATEHTMLCGHLASVCGYGTKRFNQPFGRLGHRICDALGEPAPALGKDGQGKDWYRVLAIYDHNGGRRGVWTMHDTLAQALEILELVPSMEIPLAEEIRITTDFPEGAKRQIMVNAYERNREARRRCIDHYGNRCAACNFDFIAVYGEIGEGYIQVHHLRPLSTITESYSVDPIADLRPVCPNCHAMLHRKTPPYTIEEMRIVLDKTQRRHGQ